MVSTVGVPPRWVKEVEAAGRKAQETPPVYVDMVRVRYPLAAGADLLSVCAELIERCIALHTSPLQYTTYKGKAIESPSIMQRLFPVPRATSFLFRHKDTEISLPVIPSGKYLDVLRTLRDGGMPHEPRGAVEWLFKVSLCGTGQDVHDANDGDLPLMVCCVDEEGVSIEGTQGVQYLAGMMACGREVEVTEGSLLPECCLVAELGRVVEALGVAIGSLCHVLCVVACYTVHRRFELTVDEVVLSLFQGSVSEYVFTATETMMMCALTMIDAVSSPTDVKHALRKACLHHQRLAQEAFTTPRVTMVDLTDLPAKLLTYPAGTQGIACSKAPPASDASTTCCYTTTGAQTVFTVTSRGSLTQTAADYEREFKAALGNFLHRAASCIDA
eukprot:TRINITY_DN34344_c0_g1_i1.p1 TRINITY_DN34344_c0_g1~~TRINITY_DN34344_c0_g1_i1.p1  ORF type:complete len:396 (+),score=88.65 TRINITY_DN34344_c0_g1_i1:30-1190(+)